MDFTTMKELGPTQSMSEAMGMFSFKMIAFAAGWQAAAFMALSTLPISRWTSQVITSTTLIVISTRFRRALKKQISTHDCDVKEVYNRVAADYDHSKLKLQNFFVDDDYNPWSLIIEFKIPALSFWGRTDWQPRLYTSRREVKIVLPNKTVANKFLVG